MRLSNEWVVLIMADLRSDQTSLEWHEILKSYIGMIQSDACQFERQECKLEWEPKIEHLNRECAMLRNQIDAVYEAANDAKTRAIQF